MKRQHINQLEEQLEQFIEGAFANLFGRKIRAQDVAMRLARAMEDGCLSTRDGDPRKIAPDTYTIYANPKVQRYLLEQHPDLGYTLAEHLVELASQSDYRLNQRPMVKLLASSELEVGDLTVTASHTNSRASSTAAMQPIQLPPMEAPDQPKLIIDDNRIIDLELDVYNIGRHPDNHIVLDDQTVSRHHLQIRLRYGAFYLFDVRSRSGTLVNGNAVKEHRLRSGDVIRLGRTQMVYHQDESDEEENQVTDGFDPI